MKNQVICITIFVALATLLSCRGSDPAAGLKRGQELMAAGKFEEASLQFRKLLQSQPNSAEVHYQLGLARLRQEKRSTAFWLFRKALELDPKHAGAQQQATELALAGLLAKPGSSQDLRDILETTAAQLEQGSNSYAANRIRGYLAMVREQPKSAVDYFQKALATQPGSIEMRFAIIQNLLLDGQSQAGEAQARQLIQEQPAFFPAYDVLYGLYLRNRRPGDALAVLESKIAKNAKSPALMLQLVEHHSRFGEIAVRDRAVEELTQLPGGFVAAGDFFREFGDYSRALQLYERGLAQNPAIAELKVLNNRKAQALSDAGRINEALTMLRERSSKEPRDVELQALLAAALIRTNERGQVNEGIQMLEKLVEQVPEEPAFRSTLAGALVLKGEIERGQRLFLDAWHRDPTQTKPLAALAEVALQNRQFAVARRHAEQWMTLEPGQPKARLIRAASYAGEGDLSTAARELDGLIQDEPSYTEAKLQRALLFAMQGKFGEAEAQFRKLHQPGGEDLRALKGWMEVYRMQRKSEAALNLASQELRSHPDAPGLLELYGGAAADAGKFQEAIGAYRKLLNGRSGLWRIQYRLGGLLLDSGKGSEALEPLRSAFQASDDLDAGLLYASALDETGSPTEAARVYQKLLTAHPENPAVLNNVAYRMADKGQDLDAALGFAQKASQNAPQSPDIADTLGWVYLKKGMHSSAVQVFQSLVAKHPQNPSYRYHLGLGLLEAGNRSKGIGELKKALELKPGAEDEQRIRQILGSQSPLG